MRISYKIVDRSGKREKQARKGFRPLSAMQGIGYFQNLGNFLRNCLEIFWILGGNFLGIFLEFFGGHSWRTFLEDFLGGLFWRTFLEEFFWKNFFGGIFWRNFLGGILTLLKSAKLF